MKPAPPVTRIRMMVRPVRRPGDTRRAGAWQTDAAERAAAPHPSLFRAKACPQVATRGTGFASKGRAWPAEHDRTPHERAAHRCAGQSSAFSYLKDSFIFTR